MTNDILRDVFDETLTSAISDLINKGLSFEEILNVLNKDALKTITSETLDKSAEYALPYLKDHMYEIAYEQQARTDEFVSRQRQTWGAGFAATHAMYAMVVDAADVFCKFVSEDIDDATKRSKQYTFLALQYMHGRACQVFLEILHLMQLGFADGAYARWRTMYELCCCAQFIINQGEKIARQYIDQSLTDEQKYKWTKGAIDENGKIIHANCFADIQKLVKNDSGWLAQYKLACLTTHASPQGTFGRLAGNTDGIIQVGHSNYGITTAAEHSAICLCWITNDFITLFNHMESFASCIVLKEWIDVIRDAYFSAHKKAFGEEIMKDK